jgi:hypothetical protein
LVTAAALLALALQLAPGVPGADECTTVQRPGGRLDMRCASGLTCTARPVSPTTIIGDCSDGSTTVTTIDPLRGTSETVVRDRDGVVRGRCTTDRDGKTTCRR